MLSETTKEKMEPELHFHQFIFLLGLISKARVQSPDNTIEGNLQEFYV